MDFKVCQMAEIAFGCPMNVDKRLVTKVGEAGLSRKSRVSFCLINRGFRFDKWDRVTSEERKRAESKEGGSRKRRRERGD